MNQFAELALIATNYNKMELTPINSSYYTYVECDVLSHLTPRNAFVYDIIKREINGNTISLLCYNNSLTSANFKLMGMCSFDFDADIAMFMMKEFSDEHFTDTFKREELMYLVKGRAWTVMNIVCQIQLENIDKKLFNYIRAKHPDCSSMERTTKGRALRIDIDNYTRDTFFIYESGRVNISGCKSRREAETKKKTLVDFIEQKVEELYQI
jgi:Transcription factor TFIID (or TATA-binding protein, TBP)